MQMVYLLDSEVWISNWLGEKKKLMQIYFFEGQNFTIAIIKIKAITGKA